ncbi:MAG: integrase, partial [Massilia sp.]
MMTTPGKALSDLQPKKFLRISKVNPAGSLEARKRSTGAVMLYWRVTLNGKTVRHPIGLYDSSAPPKSIIRTSKG